MVRWFHHLLKWSRQSTYSGYSNGVKINIPTQEEMDQRWRDIKSVFSKIFGALLIFIGLTCFFDNVTYGLSFLLMGIFALDYSKNVKYKSKEKGSLGRLSGIILLIGGGVGLITPEDSIIGSLFCIIIGLVLLNRYQETR